MITQLITTTDLTNRGIDITGHTTDFINTMIDDISAFIIPQCIKHGVDFFEKYNTDEVYKQNVKSVCCDLARNFLSSIESEYNSNIESMTERAGNLDLSFKMFSNSSSFILTAPQRAKLWDTGIIIDCIQTIK